MGITKTDPSRYGQLRGGSHQPTPPQSAARSETLRFRTPEPVVYSERDAQSGLTLETSLFCEGECEWSVCDAAVFDRVCAPGAKLNEQLENELSLALELALAKLDGVPSGELPGRSDEIGASLAEDLFPLWRERRGIQAKRFRLTSVTASKPADEPPVSLQLEPAAEGGWVCPKCGRTSHGNFCSNCGEKKPE